MSDNKENIGNPDRSRINTSEDYEVRYWTEKFGITAEELEEAIRQTGSSSADRVEEYLSNK
ncbi:MAG TPA: DUF3606 domain-containing protein [Flavobacterium sp.]